MGPAATNPASDPPQAQREVLLWSDSVHETDESMHLYFWRLSFAPEYEQEAIFRSLAELFDEVGIFAYVTYETLGDFDLLLRLWIPRRYIAEEIEHLLRDALRGNDLYDMNYIACRTDLHHATDASRAPSEMRDPLIRDAVITAVNDFNREQAAGRCIARPVGVNGLIKDGILIPIQLDIRGVRFYVTFDRPHRATPTARTEIRRRIVEKCIAVDSKWAERLPHGPGSQISAYSGAGTMTDYLVLARAPYGYFHAFVQELLLGLRTIGLDQYHMRPYTYVLADEMFSAFQEKRTSVATAGVTDSQLFGREHASLEFKASFATNIRRLWREGRQEPDKKVANSVIRTICGFLNSPEGGTLALGVLEVEREFERGGGGEPFVAWLSEQFVYQPDREPDGTLSRPLRNAVTGVEHEYGPQGAYRDAEEYYAAIRDALKDRIDPNPWPWLRSASRQVNDREVVVVTIRRADSWCYAKLHGEAEPQFFVREGASTRAYRGTEADLYRRAHPRS